MNRIDEVFESLRAAGRQALIPFLTAGDPDLASTPALAAALLDAGADVLEIGFPYSDPIADGPVIQASYTRALARGCRLDGVFAAARAIADAAPRTPLVAMTSYSLVHRRGPARFLDEARRAGFSGAIVPDLPAEESLALAELAQARDLKLVQLVTPTTPEARAAEVVARASGFVYCVSVAGITGERAALPAELLGRLAWLRAQTRLPLCVGFGVSTPGHVRMLRGHADGVIVGSALVRLVEQGGTVEEIAERLRGLTRQLKGAVE